LYGSSRFGMLQIPRVYDSGAKPNKEVTNYTPSNISWVATNFKNYELTNHLGNVLSTIKDEKQQIDANNDGLVDYYEPIVITANDYYPFGMPMPNRTFSLSSKGYRFGFNGQEKDDEVYGSCNAVSFKYRIEDVRIGRFLSEDPLSKKFPWLSTYQFAANNPIANIDLEGAENLYYLNSFKKEGFASSNSLRVSTNSGIKEQIKIYNTEKRDIKHDVYMKFVDEKSFSSITTGAAFTRSFKSEELSNDGKFNGKWIKFQTDNTNKGERKILSSIKYNSTNEDNKIIHVIVINEKDFANRSQEERAHVVHHELKSHVTSLIGNEKAVYKDNMLQQHEDYHGFKDRESPKLGKEKKGTPQEKFRKEIEKSSYNEKNK